MNLTELSNKISNAPALDFGNIFSEAIELFKRTWGQGVLLLLLNMILVFPAVLILYIPIIAAAAASGSTELEMQAGNLSPWYMIFFFLLFIPVMALVQTITLGLTAGFYKIVKEKDLNDEIGEQASLFMFLKKPYLGKLFLLSLISLGIALLAALLCYLPIIYVMVPLGLFAVIFAFNPELSAKEIVKSAFQLGNKKWLLIFGLVVVTSLLAQVVGLLLCGIGVIFTASFAFLPNYLVYKKTVGFEDSTEISEIGTTEI